MVSLARFCPFERLVSILNKIGYENSVQKVIVQWDGVSRTSVVDVTKKYADFNLGFSETERLSALRADSISATVFFDDRRYQLVCYNDLVAESNIPQTAKVDGKSVYNGILSNGQKAVYPEAFRTTALSILDSSQADLDLFVSGARAFYQYVLEYVDTETKLISVRGPSNRFFQLRPAYIMNTEFGPFSILTDSERPMESVVEPEEIVRLNGRRFRPVSVILTYDNGAEQPYVVKQDIITIRGTPLSCEASLAIFKLVTFLEMAELQGYQSPVVDSLLNYDPDTGVVRVPIIQVAGHYIIPGEYQAKLIEYTADASGVNAIFGRYVASADEFLVRARSNDVGMLMSNIRGTQSCFAFAFCAAVVRDMPTCVFFDLLTTLIDLDIIQIKKGVLTGYTRSGDIVDKGIDVTLPVVGLKLGALRRQAARGQNAIKAYDNAAPGTVLLVGGDFRNERNNAPGDPDHYLLAQKTEHGLMVVYDPLASAGRQYGYEISDPASIRDLEIGEVTYDKKWV